MSTELFKAIEKHDAKKVTLILESGVSPNTALIESPFWKPLEAAIEELESGGKIEVINELIKYGADVNAWDEAHSLTPMHCAVFSLNMDVIKLLLDEGADPNKATDEGMTPLIWAAENKNIELAKMLITKCNIDNINYFGGFCGESALDIAVKNLDKSMVELLLNSGADPDALTADGQPARVFLPNRNKANLDLWKQVASQLNNA